MTMSLDLTLGNSGNFARFGIITPNSELVGCVASPDHFTPGLTGNHVKN